MKYAYGNNAELSTTLEILPTNFDAAIGNLQLYIFFESGGAL
jgi:hypothetical protein